MSSQLPVIDLTDPDIDTGFQDPVRSTGLYPGEWWHAEGDRIVCDLCPRRCVMKAGDRGFCFVRQNVDNKMYLTTYGRSTGFCIDPIEKKPLNHFFPGTSILSFGTAGCNLGCKFCQNWDISKSREVERLSERAMPDEIADAASSLGCSSVAFTYNDPVIWAEYAIDTAKACRARGLKSVAVTAGYITEEARAPFYEYIDAANVDLKAFTEEFYYKITYSHLQPILDTLIWLKAETDVWFEITNLIIPDANDNPDELRRMCEWILEAVGADVPVHFTAFHPDFRMRDRPNTPQETLIAAREIALKAGIHYAYTGNVDDWSRQSTYCPGCQRAVIERNWYELGQYSLNGNACGHCGYEINGHFSDRPGTWGRKRQPVDMRMYRRETTSESSEPNRAHATPPKITPAKANSSNSQQEGRNSMSTAAPTGIDLSEQQQSQVLKAAAELVQTAAATRKSATSQSLGVDLAGQSVSGVFVSLKRDGRLRSCCGSFGTTQSLGQAMRDAAFRTVTSDPRFPPVSLSELAYLDFEVWLLFAPEEVQEKGDARIQAVTIGTHGLQIVRGGNRGLLLPGVATDNGWNSEEFLNNVCVKAGLPVTAWKDDSTTLYRFGGRVVRGPLGEYVKDAVLDSPTLFSEQEIAAYVEYCSNTISALLSGATPTYYCTTVADANVNGAIIEATKKNTDVRVSASKISLRQSMPLQATLFSQCEELAKVLRRNGARPQNIELKIAFAFDPAMHGTVAAADLGGIDPRTRGVLVQERSKTGLAFDITSSPEQLLKEACQQISVTDPELSSLYSLRVQSSADQISMADVPHAVNGPGVRPPAVAGTFYPDDAAEIDQMLEDFLSAKIRPRAYSAAMVPHAGWKYSGRLAATVLQRIKFPETAIVIGPKHTPHGVDWAVAPHYTWQLPSGTVDCDSTLANELADAIPGLQLDAVAHQNEHGIEVELPIIQRLAPNTRVVGIAIGSGSLQRCGEFADGLAKVISARKVAPLLIISSDMNHFANDSETRRLDEMALKEIDRLDPDALHRTVRQNQISMCGVLPAVIVMKTLQRLRKLKTSERVGYATSADVTGDTSRVVGYAGTLFR